MINVFKDSSFPEVKCHFQAEKKSHNKSDHFGEYKLYALIQNFYVKYFYETTNHMRLLVRQLLVIIWRTKVWYHKFTIDIFRGTKQIVAYFTKIQNPIINYLYSF